jgi:hypothetical protein
VLSKDEWASWKNDKVTRELLRLLDDKREIMKEEWASHKFSDESEQYILMGHVQALKDVVDLVLYDFPVETTDDGESRSV